MFQRKKCRPKISETTDNISTKTLSRNDRYSSSRILPLACYLHIAHTHFLSSSCQPLHHIYLVLHIPTNRPRKKSTFYENGGINISLRLSFPQIPLKLRNGSHNGWIPAVILPLPKNKTTVLSHKNPEYSRAEAVFM
jgi:hypothetical protein